MSRLLSIALLASVASFGFGVSGSIAAPLPDNCTKDQGVVTCQTSDPVGNSENSGGNSQTRDTTDTSRGNLTNKKSSCTSGPGNQTTC
jgi:hypothetical protein